MLAKQFSGAAGADFVVGNMSAASATLAMLTVTNAARQNAFMISRPRKV